MFMLIFSCSIILAFALGFLAGNWNRDMARRVWRDLRQDNERLTSEKKLLEHRLLSYRQN